MPDESVLEHAPEVQASTVHCFLSSHWELDVQLAQAPARQILPEAQAAPVPQAQAPEAQLSALKEQGGSVPQRHPLVVQVSDTLAQAGLVPHLVEVQIQNETPVMTLKITECSMEMVLVVRDHEYWLLEVEVVVFSLSMRWLSLKPRSNDTCLTGNR